MQIELWDEMAALERRMDELFRTFLGPRARLTFPALPMRLRRPFVPAIDVFSRGKDLVVRMELPGIDAVKDVAVTMEEDELVIRGERRRKEEVKEEHYYRMEASYGAFERHIPIPEGVDEGKIKAEYVDGVLEVVVPAAAKAMPPKARSIPIRTTRAVKAA
ncbi:MAG: Hsp20/alpha crystallin family protein [Actinobacteria bacterium]|nr:Hsp20/alpha crystallin family protein [Actinomycetota bacterium]